jgi:hypothetical protein
MLFIIMVCLTVGLAYYKVSMYLLLQCPLIFEVVFVGNPHQASSFVGSRYLHSTERTGTDPVTVGSGTGRTVDGRYGREQGWGNSQCLEVGGIEGFEKL